MPRNCGIIYRIYCQRPGPCHRNFCLAVRCGKVVIVAPNNSDTTQLWRKEYVNCGGFMLVNNCSNMSIRYHGMSIQLDLVSKSNCPPSSVIWTESGDRPSSYGFLRTKNDCNAVMVAWIGNHIDISEGLKVSIYERRHSDNQFWKFVPYGYIA